MILLLSLDTLNFKAYDLPVMDNPNPSNDFAIISVSRNSPIALLVGAAGFLGSHLTEALLNKGVQVLGVDNLSSGNKRNLEGAVKSKKFHFINKSITERIPLNLPRLDYAFFVASLPNTPMFSGQSRRLYELGLHNFLEEAKKYSPKICLVSSIDLYDRKVDPSTMPLKRAEVSLARFIKDNKLNARVVRLATLFGPRMHFRDEEPITRLIQSALLGELEKEQTSLDFSSRALFVSDAADLLIRSVFYGGTTHKIYDGVATKPVRVSEIKQILLDPLWYEEKGFVPKEIPPWPTPNLDKSIKDLNWKPNVNIVAALRETVSYFKDREDLVPKLPLEELEKEAVIWNREEEAVLLKKEEVKIEKKPKFKFSGFGLSKENWKIKALLALGLGIIAYGVLLPILSLIIGVFSLRASLGLAASGLAVGDFEKAKLQIKIADSSLKDLEGLSKQAAIFKKIPGLEGSLNNFNELLEVSEEGVSGVGHTIAGAESLYKVTKVISGEEVGDLSPVFAASFSEFTRGEEEISISLAKLSDPLFTEGLPIFVRGKAEDFREKLRFYSDFVQKGEVATSILPGLVASVGKKSYLILLSDNFEERGSGGVIPNIARLNFENGRLVSINVDRVENLDKKLVEHIEPPPELKSDTGKDSWSLSDSGFDPDFPTSAKRAEFFYAKEQGERVNGVISLDQTEVGNLLKAVGGVTLTDYQEEVSGDDFSQKMLSHAKDTAYLTSLDNQLLNKVFFSSQKDWPKIIQALSVGLESKHIQVFIDDPTTLSTILSQNWSGVLPRPGNSNESELDDFLGVIDSNMGGNLVDFYIDKSYSLETSINPEGGIFHHLLVKYKNNSISSDFPAGSYKNRVRLYLPVGSKLTKLTFGESDLTASIGSSSDYGRAVYSALININPKEEKNLVVDYSLPKALNFEKGGANYNLFIFKQAGSASDPFTWNITFPDSFKLASGKREANFSTDLSKDRSLSVGFRR